MTPEQREKITNLLKANDFGVIATHSSVTPESAVITIFETDQLEIVFGSLKGSRKNTNIEQNPNVSLVVGWDKQTRQTLQLEGIAMHISPEEREALENHIVENKRANTFHIDPTREYYKITPHWVRYSDFGVTPREVWEITIS